MAFSEECHAAVGSGVREEGWQTMTPEEFKEIMKAAGVDVDDDDADWETSSIAALKLDENDAALHWSAGSEIDAAIEKNIKAAQVSLLAGLEPCLSKGGLTIYTSSWESSLNYDWKELLEFCGIDEIEEYDEKVDKIIEAINAARKSWKDKWHDRGKG